MVLDAGSGGGMIAVELRLAGGRVHYILTTWLLRCKVLLVSQDADEADAADAARHDERVGRLCRCRRRGPRVRCESRPEDRVDTRRSRPRGECGEQPNIEADVAGLGCLDGRPRARAFTAVCLARTLEDGRSHCVCCAQSSCSRAGHSQPRQSTRFRMFGSGRECECGGSFKVVIG